MATNRFYATRAAYDLPASLLAGGGGIQFGRGVDMTDPLHPELVPNLSRFFTKTEKQEEGHDEELHVSGDTIKDSFSLLQSDTIESEASALNTYFRASYSLSSIEGAMELARSSRREGHSAYVLLRHVGDSGPDPALHWHVRDDLQLPSEDINDEEEAFTQFRREFGTHYIHGINYGLTIAIRGTLHSEDSTEQQRLGTRLKAGFSAFRAEGGLSDEAKKSLESDSLELSAEVNCGGMVPERPLVMGSFKEIATFLKEIRDGTIKFRLAPVEVHLASYWSLLPHGRFPRSRELLNPVRFGSEFKPDPACFGVPAGTVIAWQPTAAHIENAGDPARAVIRPPQGWALCDGQDGRPDLRGRFIRGTGQLGAIGETGGAEVHDHELLSGGVHGERGSRTLAFVSARALRQTNVPPFVHLVYLIKLRE